MHAIVCQGNGKYYVSAVFGYYEDITAKDDYQRYLERIHKPYFIVWDLEKKRLIRWQKMAPNTSDLVKQILIVDSDQSGWNMDEDGVGCVGFLSRQLLDSFLDAEIQPPDILAKCHAMDDGYKYNETPEIRTQKDIEDLEYDTSSRHSEEWIPYWTGSTLILRDGFVYFVDEYIDADDITEDKLKSGYYCYFKARHMKYRIIPD